MAYCYTSLKLQENTAEFNAKPPNFTTTTPNFSMATPISACIKYIMHKYAISFICVKNAYALSKFSCMISTDYNLKFL